ncbi:MAG: DUF6886 family protein [Fimbriimonas sp.]
MKLFLRPPMELYHFSEDPGIERFVPRAPRRHPDAEPMVWAIDAWHAPLYFVPSDCPRVCFWPLPTTSEADLYRFWTNSDAKLVIAIEHDWAERLLTIPIYRYRLPVDSFEDCKDHGVFTSRLTVVPSSVEPLGNPLAAFAQSRIELRLLPSLVSLAQNLIGTSLHWSLIRMGNARGWDGPKGTPTVPPSA